MTVCFFISTSTASWVATGSSFIAASILISPSSAGDGMKVKVSGELQTGIGREYRSVRSVVLTISLAILGGRCA